VRLWSVARSNAQIAADMNAALPAPQAGLVMRLGLDDASGDTANDSSGSANHAVLERFNAGGFTGRIDHAGQRDSHTFTLTETKRLVVDMLFPYASQLYLSLTGPRGTEFANWQFHNADGSAGGNRLLTLPPGTYTATVDAAGDWTGWYNFRLLDLAQATPVATNTVVSGTLAPGSSTQLVRFAGATMSASPAAPMRGCTTRSASCCLARSDWAVCATRAC
jgi:large repetitive protein